MQKRRAALLVLFVAVLRDARTLHAQSDAARKAMAAIVGLDLSSADIVDWCSSRAPTSAAPLNAAWQAWRTANAVDDVTRRVDAELLRRTRDGMATVISATRQKLQQSGQPSAVCSQLESMWSSAEFDARRTYAAAYTRVSETADRSPGVIAPATTVPATNAAPPTVPTGRDALQPRAQFDSRYYAGTARPTGTVYSVAQLTALRQEWVGTPSNYSRGVQAARAAGTLYITGTVVRRRDRFHLLTVDGAFNSALSVAPGIDISAFEGQQITLQGTVDELPSSLFFLRDTRVVRDASGLRPSTLPSDPGMRRTTVAVAQITTAPGSGVQSRELLGMHYHWYYMGTEFREESRLLFRDGWAYLRNDVPPSDLDVAASRRLEPQRWAHWRRAGNEYEFQTQNDHGQPDGDWFTKSGRLLPTWTANQRLSGTYSSSAFSGSAALGGTYSSTSFSFTPDGRWERIGFSQSSSGGMAAQQPVGFSASATSVSDASGTKSSAGGGNANVSASSSSERNDGAKNRGTYRLDGMTLELKADDGTVARVSCVPMDGAMKAIFLFGSSYSRK